MKPNQTITAERYQQLIDLNRALSQKRPIIVQRKSDSVDNARLHVAKTVKDMLSHSLLSHIAYPPNCLASDFHLFRCSTVLLISTSKHIKK